MLKKILVLCTIFTAIIAGAVFVLNFSITSNTKVFADSVSFSYNEKVAYEGDSFCVSGDVIVFPKNTEEKSIYSSSNTSVASISALTGVVDCLSEGTTNIVTRIKSGEGDYINTYFVLNVLASNSEENDSSNDEDINYAIGLQIAKETVVMPVGDLGIQGYESYNILIVLGEDITVIPSVEYSSTNIVEYNCESGAITALNLGEVTVTVTIATSKNDTCSVSFTVTVQSDAEQTVILEDGLYTFKFYSDNVFTEEYIIEELSVDGGNAFVLHYQIFNEQGIKVENLSVFDINLSVLSGGEVVSKTTNRSNNFTQFLILGGGTAIVELDYQGNTSQITINIA